MTSPVESVAVGIIAGGSDDKDKQDLQSCDWKACTHNHTKKPAYPQNGTVARNGSYSEDWVGAGLEPWVKYGPGINSRATLADYRDETKKAAYAVTAAALVHPAYHTQKHHLISVNLFDNVPDLSHDAKLIGYNVNHKNNGVCLPTYVADIVQHDLQCHRGSHPNNEYNVHIVPLLEQIELRCIKYCQSDAAGTVENQGKLIGDLNRLSQRVEGQIKGWKWLLRSDAHNERTKSKADYAKRLQPQGAQ
jgi:hypothetical protein